MDDAAYRAARRRVIRHLILQITFVANVLFYLLTTILILITPSKYGVTDVPGSTVAGALVWSVIWGTILFIHAMFAFDLFRGRIDRAVQRELQREALKEKPKRQVVGLGEDGELIDVEEEAPLARRSGGESRPQ